ncbi:FecR family protein [Spirochaeta dissipatitropha]
MRVQLRRSLLSVLFFLLAVTVLQAQIAEPVVARRVTGTVEVRVNGGAWEPLFDGDEITVGSTISTGFSSTAVLEIGLAVLEVQALSRMTIEDLIEEQGVIESDVYLEVGRVRADVRRVEDRRQDFRLRSPVATAAVRGTSFSFDGRNLEVTTGVVELANLRGRRSVVPQGYRSRVVDNAPPPPPRQAAQEDNRVSHDTSVRQESGGGGDEGGSSDDDDTVSTVFDNVLNEPDIEYGTLVVEFR